MGDDRQRPPRGSPEAEVEAAGNETSGAGGSEHAHWQALLKRLGLETLQLPSDGTLAGQWKEFLEQFEAKEVARRRAKRERQ